MAGDEPDRGAALAARVDALSATLKSVLATLVLRGVLNRADLARLLQETAATLQTVDPNPAATAELRAIEAEMPGYLRAALGPPPDPDDDDH